MEMSKSKEKYNEDISIAKMVKIFVSKKMSRRMTKREIARMHERADAVGSRRSNIRLKKWWR